MVPAPRLCRSLRPALLALALTQGAATLLALPGAADGGDGYRHSQKREDDDDHGHDHDRARDALMQGEALPLTVILDRAAALVDGRFLEAELESGHDGLVYEITIVSAGGRVTRLDFDAATGDLIARRDGKD
ncbi:hypothetical protein CKO38_01550 [Rhodospirillum rubrum]|uniref:PepSY domain-containing protein n=1 Tax=Rhodospirillum rubrum TaxID=1085 RepID=UPI001903021D|nr:PepSY domain-containing protein [Rhodospirillum rubrum]MBK1663436.1 hypothetical protein [Rhodospirillum rubrum]MBK1675381.1 hypothetical protein [Rhodospirillum rubrum]